MMIPTARARCYEPDRRRLQSHAMHTTAERRE